MLPQTLTCARPLRRKALLAIVLTILGLSCLAQSALAASDEKPGDTFPVSITPGGEFAESGTGEATSVSADGRYVEFLSAAENLGEEGPTGVKEAYVKDLHTGALELVSRTNGVDGEPASEAVQSAVISGDGRYVIFSSTAPNLLGGAGEEGLHVYRRDLQTGETMIVDRVTGAKGAIVTKKAAADAISADGRYVVFGADVEDLEDPAGAHAIASGLTLYARDLQTGTTTAVSRASGPGGALADQSASAAADSISPEGRYVVFASAATNLVPGMTANTVSQVYLRDLREETTTLVSKTAPSEAAPAGEPGNAPSNVGMLVGAGGCEVAYDSGASNLYSFAGKPVATPEVYLTNLCSTPAQTSLVSRANGEAGAPAAEGNAATPRVYGASADGRYILFSALGALLSELENTSKHLYLRDLQTGETTLVDRATGPSGEAANANPAASAISANGCRAVFTTKASNLAEPNPPEAQLEVYVRQLAACNEEPAITPTDIAFGAQALDTIGAARTITVTAGSEALQIQRAPIDGTDLSDFIVTGDQCTGETLEPEGKCTLMVRFAPSATGPRSASLKLRTAPTTSFEVDLSGEGTSLPSGEGGASGKEGPRGATGAQGSTGQQGSTGPLGSAGPQGSAGQRGPAGQQGTKGKRGVPGPAGPQARVTCKVVARKRRVTCASTFKGQRRSRRRMRPPHPGRRVRRQTSKRRPPDWSCTPSFPTVPTVMPPRRTPFVA